MGVDAWFVLVKEQSMSVAELALVVPPPDHPVEVGSDADWHRSEVSFGVSFPPDLHELCVHYGSGYFANIEIYNPFSASYTIVIEEVLALFRHLSQELGAAEVPFPLYPNRPGLLPVGGDNNGGVLFWLVDDAASTWPLVLWLKGGIWERLDLSLTTFLTRMAQKGIECVWWDQEWLEECFPKIEFVPRPLGGP